jgi:hypothetical protein
VPEKASLYELHETLVSSAKDENPLSRRIDSLLGRKFGPETEQLLELGPRSLTAHCKAAFKEGSAAPPVWTAAVYPDLPQELKKEIYGVIHMSMHVQGQQLMDMRRKLARQDQELTRRSRKLKETARDRKRLQRESETLYREHQRTKARAEAAESEVARLQAELVSMAEYRRVQQDVSHARKFELELGVRGTVGVGPLRGA